MSWRTDLTQIQLPLPPVVSNKQIEENINRNRKLHEELTKLTASESASKKNAARIKEIRSQLGMMITYDGK
jgi:hypothetical protein